MVMKNPLMALALVAGMFFADGVFAREGTALGISPALFQIDAKQGDVVEDFVTINNPTESVMSVKMTVEDIKPSGDEGEVIVTEPGSENYSISKWVKCDPETVELNPGEEKVVKFTISVPQNAEPGGHYGAVAVAPVGVASLSGTGAAVVIRVTTVILVTIPGEMKEDISVEEFYSQLRDKNEKREVYKNTNFFQYPPIGFAAKFANEGAIHLKPSASVIITDIFGQQIAQVPFPQQNVLPGAERIIHAEWSGQGFLIGPYTATIAGSFGTYNIPLNSKSITFWVVPVREILIALVILVFIALTRKRWGAALKIIFTGKH